MNKHSWKLRQLDVAAVLAEAPSLSSAARTLGVNRSSIQRWIRAGKVPPFSPSPRAPRLAPTSQQPEREPEPVATAGWAASVRAAYDLTATELELLALAERARTIALDDTQKPETQLAAAGRFQTLIRQLNLETPDNGEVETNDTRKRVWPRRVS